MLCFVISGSQRGRALPEARRVSACAAAECSAAAIVPAHCTTSFSGATWLRDQDGQRSLQRGQVVVLQGGVGGGGQSVKIVINFLRSLYVPNLIISVI